MKTADQLYAESKNMIYKEMSLEETTNCKDRVPGKGLDDNFCRHEKCHCIYKSYEEVMLYIDCQKLTFGEKSIYTGATKL